jgi:RimJ/RimL family protein N-acetyltransferase
MSNEALSRWPLAPVTLSGKHVHLQPLAAAHHDGLVTATRDGELWRLWYTTAPSPEGMSAEIERRLSLQVAGSMLPFTVIDAVTGQVAGMTTFMNIDAANRRLEIGSTWYAHRVQRTALNTEAKLLLLTHAFEALGCVAVEFRTHILNQQSRRAIERLGATLDGILRNHMVMPDGLLRDTCVYSILDSEWPVVRKHLQWQLERPR